MMKELKYDFFKWCVFLIIIIQHTIGFTQTYPVQTNIVAVGPYYNYLNYYADENAHLQIITTLTDFNTAPVNVRLRIQFIGPGYTISTKPNAIIGQAFTLEPGVPLFINGIDLLPYFYETNVVKSPSGINLNSLPEGLTTVCVDVIRDGVSQEVLSTNNCTSFFLQRFQPPQGIFPQCGSNIHPDEGFYTFQWSPPVGYVPSIGSELNYTFSLYEWNDPNNYNIFQTGQGLVYQTVTQQPIVQLSNFDLTLQNGKNYVWRVQAQLLSNGLPVNMIENNGLSGICTFTYGTAQTLEESLAEGLHIDISAMGDGERKGKASWTVIDNTPGEGLSTFSSYIVYYRKKPSGNEGYELTWFQDTVSSFNHLIYQLEPATTYEVKVAGRVGENYVSEISETKEFTTYSPRAYACGETDMPYRSQIYQPLAQAQAGMHFQIGQFSMQVTEISPVGAAGHYQGKGLIPIAFLAGAKAKVTFDDILVDDKYMVREGMVQVMTKGIDQWLHEQYEQFIDPIYVSGTVDSAYVDTASHTAWVVIDGQSQSWPFDPPDYPIIVNDDSGTQYIIHPNGTITKSSYFEILEEWNDVTAQEIVTFSQSENETFGFDAKQHTQWHDNYDIIQLADSSYYFASNKSLGVGKTDVVQVNLPAGGTGYTYKINNGTAQPLSSGTFTIPAQNTKGDFNLEVFQGTKKVGKLKLIVFEEKEINLVVVPLVGNTPTKTELETALNKTLGEANLKFNVVIKPQWNNTLFTSSKTIQLPEDITLLNKYSSDMASLRDAYFAANDTVNRNAFFLFVVPSFSDNAIDGYMVRGKSLGFVAANANLQTYVHELGHGVGSLKHSWQDNGPALGTTNNLMDYSEDATNLTKAQWKQIRSWNLMPSMWDEAEDGMAINNTFSKSDISNQYTYVNTNLIDVNTKFTATNGLIFSLSSSILSKFEKVVLLNGKLYAAYTSDMVFWKLATHSQDVSTGVLIQKPVAVFYDSTIVNRYGSRVFNGKNLEYVKRDPTDISIERFYSCNEVSQVVSGVNNNQLEYTSVNCPERPEDCQWTSTFVYDNLGSCAFRVNRSSISCLKGLSTTRKELLIGIFASHIKTLNPQNSQLYYDSINFETLGVGAPGWIPNVFQDGGTYDIGRALTKMIAASVEDISVRQYIKNEIQKNNYELLHVLLIDWDFSSVTFPLIQLLEYLPSNPPNVQGEQVEVFGSSFTKSPILDPYILSFTGNASSVFSADYGCRYSSGMQRMSMSTSGMLTSINNVSETSYILVQKETFVNNGGFVSDFNTAYNLLGNSVTPLNTLSFYINNEVFSGYEFNDYYSISVPRTYSFSGRTIDPFEQMAFIFTENQNALGIEAGKVYIKPAIWGLCMEKAIIDYLDQLEGRKIGNYVMIAGGTIAAPFTGGATLALSIATATTAAFDLCFMNIEQGQTLDEYRDGATFRNAWNAIYTTVQIVDGIVAAPAIITSLPQFYKLVKESKYVLATKRFVKNNFFEFVRGKSVNGAGDLLSIRTNWLNNLKSQFNVNDAFLPQGLNPNSINSTLKNQILDGFSSMLDQSTKEILLNRLIKSGSSIPVKKTFSVGDELYKIVPKGNGYTQSSFYISKAEFNALKNSADLEQKLGLPLGSHAVEYDVYKATANQSVDVFESTIANTVQGNYITTGGAKQTFLLDDSKWTITLESKSLIPPK